MGWIRDSIRDYIELYRPLRRSFIGWRSPLVLWPCLMMMAIGYFAVILNRQAAVTGYAGYYWEDRELATASLALPLLIGLASWLSIAIGNQQISSPLLDSALLSRRGNGGSFRFLLAMHSGFWPLLVATLVIGIALTVYIISIANVDPREFFNRGYIGQEVRNMLASEHNANIAMVNGWLGRLLLHGWLTAIPLALLCMTRRASYAIGIFALFNLSLLELVIRPFMRLSDYGESFSHMNQTPGMLLMLALLLSACLPLLLPIGNLLRRDSLLMYSTASIVLFRLFHLLNLLAYTRVGYNFAEYNAGDAVTEGINEFVWLFNLPYQLVPFRYEMTYAGYELSRDYSSVPPMTLNLYLQLPFYNSTAAFSHLIALLLNCCCFFLVCVVCLYCVRRHEREMVS